MTSTDGSKSKNLRLIIFAVVGVSIIVGGWYLMQIQRDKLDFSIPDINGDTVTPSDYSGEVVVLDFMATW